VHRGKAAQLPIPIEVDALMLEMGHTTTPDAVLKTIEEVLPKRMVRADGRPVHLIWWHGHRQKPEGLVPECQPGMVRTLGQVAETNDLSGIFFISYGTGYHGATGIGTSPGLVSEIREIAARWEIGSPRRGG
jgi:hypothetical protein